MTKKNILLVPLFLFFVLIAIQSNAQIKKDTISFAKISLQGDSLFRAASYEAASEKYGIASEGYKKYALWNNYFLCQSKIIENFSRQGKCDEAIDLSLLTLESISKYKLKSTSIEAIVLNRLGFAYLSKGRSDLALEQLKKALDILVLGKSVNKIELASCYKNLGLAYWSVANNELALEHLQKSLSLSKETNSETSPEVADIYNNIGLVYSSNDSDKALEYYLKALAIYEKVYGTNHPNVAITTNNIAIIQRKQKKYDESLANFQKVLYVWESMNKGRRHPNEAFVFTNVGQVYFDKGEMEKALELQNKALTIYKENYGEKHPEIAGVFNQLGVIYLSQRKFKLALENFQFAICANVASFGNNEVQANPIIGDSYNANVLLFSLLMKARVLEEQYTSKTLNPADLKLALRTFYSCDTLIEKIRKIQTNKNDKIELGKIASNVYEDAIRVCMTLREGIINKRNVNEMAFYFAEKSKTAVLLEAISDAEAKHFANIPDSLLEKERFIKAEVAYCEQKLAEKTDLITEQKFRDKLFSLNREYEKFISALEKQFPEYYNLKFNVKSTSVSSLQKMLDKKTVLVSYFIADASKRVYVFYVSSKKFEVYDVPENELLNKLLIGYRNAIRFDAQELFADIAYQLKTQLLPFKIGKSIETLVIVPDGKLGTIPFESFLTSKVDWQKDKISNYPFLIKKCAVVYSYSANLYEQSKLKVVSNDGSLFLCAPIDFPSQKGHSLNSLPATKAEVNSIGGLFKDKGISSNCYTGKSVQESLIKSAALEQCKFLHFATHGIVDEIKPELSEIYLSADTTGKEDGNLYAGEIYNLKIKADLVTLSACQTGLGKVQKGEGIIGLSRALLYAGASNLVVSLWSVADKSTSLLMIDFYSNLLSDKTHQGDYGYSLRLAKLKMIENEQFNKPFYWAPFILIGK